MPESALWSLRPFTNPAVFEAALALSEEHSTPFILVDPTPALEIASELSQTLGAIRYAVKAGPYPSLIAALAASGHGFDVASPAELKLVLAHGARVENCICANPAISPAAITTFLRSGLRLFVIDDFDCATAIAVAAYKAHIPFHELRLLVRLDLSDDSAHLNLANKFGVSYEEGILLGVFLPREGLTIAGVHFHLGSQATSATAAGEAAATALRFVTELHIPDPIIDVGGGLPAPYEGRTDWRPIARALAAPLVGQRVYTEPGRLLASGAATVVASVIATATRHGRHYTHLDAGAYHGLLEFSGLPQGSPLTTTVGAITDVPELPHPTYLVGPTCDSLDVLFSGPVMLPPLVAGDLVLFDLSGAYAGTTSSTFNGFPPPLAYEI